MSLPENLIHTINASLHVDSCPTAGSLGECAIICEFMPSLYQAILYIWDAEFNDSTKVAGWFKSAGAGNVTVAHTLYSDDNDDRDGKTTDGVREWTVYFGMGAQ